MQKEELFKQAVEASRDSIYRICCCYVANGDERKDVYQEILVHIWKSLGSFEGRAQITTWIYRIAVNTCLGHLRAEKRRRSLFIEDGTISAEGLPEDAGGASGTDDDLPRLYACIARLAPVDRTLISLYLEELSTRQMAEILGITEGNVRVRLHRIRRDLRDIWERDGHGSR